MTCIQYSSLRMSIYPHSRRVSRALNFSPEQVDDLHHSAKVNGVSVQIGMNGTSNE